jgi:hypothetical protein
MALSMKVAAAALVVVSAEGAGVAQGSAMQSHANPIRRVVTMLQKIQKKVETEGETETDLHEKFMCQCKTGTASYTQSISDGGAKGEQLASSLTAAQELLVTLKSDLSVTNQIAKRQRRPWPLPRQCAGRRPQRLLASKPSRRLTLQP